MSNPFITFFDDIGKIFKKIFADEQKVQAVAGAILTDAPVLQKALPPFWASTVTMASALGVAVDDKGISIPADTAAYSAVVAWFTAFKAFDAAIEQVYKDSSTAAAAAPPTTTVPATTVAAVATTAATPSK